MNNGTFPNVNSNFHTGTIVLPGSKPDESKKISVRIDNQLVKSEKSNGEISNIVNDVMSQLKEKELSSCKNFVLCTHGQEVKVNLNDTEIKIEKLMPR